MEAFMYTNQHSAKPTPVLVEPLKARTPAQALSIMPLSDWRGSITGFPGFTGTKPNLEQHDVTWDVIRKTLAPEQPAILVDKSKGQFFVPCALKEAPLVAKTLDAAIKNGQPTTGRMRSKQHVTVASWLVIDCDGLPLADFKAALKKISDDGITLLAFTTHSHGSAEKPGVRARIAIPLDRPVTTEEYSIAWHGFDALYLGGTE